MEIFINTRDTTMHSSMRETGVSSCHLFLASGSLMGGESMKMFDDDEGDEDYDGDEEDTGDEGDGDEGEDW